MISELQIWAECLTSVMASSSIFNDHEFLRPYMKVWNLNYLHARAASLTASSWDQFLFSEASLLNQREERKKLHPFSKFLWYFE